MKKWTKIKSKKIHQNPWFSVYTDDVFKPNGDRGKYYWIDYDPGVTVIPFDGKKIYLINQYRYSFQKRNWELPAGSSITGRNLLASAKRELKEETGLIAKKWKYLGRFAAFPGSSNLVGHAFLAEKLVRGQPEREAGESDIEVKAFSLKQIDQMIKKGQLVDAWAIAPLYFFKQYKKL